MNIAPRAFDLSQIRPGDLIIVGYPDCPEGTDRHWTAFLLALRSSIAKAGLNWTLQESEIGKHYVLRIAPPFADEQDENAAPAARSAKP